MKVYVDTNVLVARCVAQHPHHDHAVALFREIEAKRWIPVISAHGLAEVYAVLTAAPFKPRISALEAWQILDRNILGRIEAKPLGRKDYVHILKESAAQGWTGGRIYDAIHIHAARKTECTKIFTFNVQHFRQIAPDLLDRIMAP